MTELTPPDEQQSMRDTAAATATPEEDRDRVARILRARAEALARPFDQGEIEETTDLVTLDVAGRVCGIEAAVVREVLAIREVTPLPTAPSFVLGVTNVRGKIIAVLDLGAVLGRGSVSRASGQLIIVEVGGVEVGVDVRECGVARVPHSRMLAAASTAGAYVKLVTAEDLEVLDLGKIIAETRQTAASLAIGAGA